MRATTREDWQGFWRRACAAGEYIVPKDAFYLMDRTKMARLRPLLPAPRARTLEVGAGSGRLSRFLAELGHEVCCLDFCREALEYAARGFAQEGLRATFVEGLAEELPFSTGHFDMVLSTGLLEHFEDPRPIVEEMVRVLRPGGLFYSDVVPKKFSLLRSLAFVRPLLGREVKPVFEMPFTKKDIEGFLRGAGLRGVTVFPAAIFPPQLPILRGWPIVPLSEALVARATEPLLRRLDGTILAEWLGFLYFAYGYK